MGKGHKPRPVINQKAFDETMDRVYPSKKLFKVIDQYGDVYYTKIPKPLGSEIEFNIGDKLD